MWDHYLNESLFRTGRGPLRKGHYGKSDLISNKYGTCLIGVDRVIVCVHWRHLVLEKYLGVILFQKSTLESSCFRKVRWSHLVLEKYDGVILFQKKYIGVVLFQKSILESSYFRKVHWNHLVLGQYLGVILYQKKYIGVILFQKSTLESSCFRKGHYCFSLALI